MSRRLLALILSIVIVAVVILLYYWLVVLPKQQATSQALAVGSIPPSPSSTPSPVPPPSPVPIGIPFVVHSGSYLANFAGQQIIVAAQPMFIGDSVWLILQLPNGNYVAEVMNVVSAENIGVGTNIVKGSVITPVLA